MPVRLGNSEHATNPFLQEVTGSQLNDLSQLTGRAPLILCGGALDRATLAQANPPPTRTLLRPFTVGDLLQEVRRALP